MNKFHDFNATKERYQFLIDCVDTGTENDCRDALLPFCEYLANKHNMHIETAMYEYAADDGDRADLILVCVPTYIPKDLDSSTAILQHKKCIVYECKSPRKDVVTMKKKDAKRPNRSDEWIEAEDQLVYYSDLIENNQNIQRHASTISPRIEHGGIIIGRDVPEDYRYYYWLYKNAAKHNVFTWDDVIADIGRYFNLESDK